LQLVKQIKQNNLNITTFQVIERADSKNSVSRKTRLNFWQKFTGTWNAKFAFLIYQFGTVRDNKFLPIKICIFNIV